MTARDVTDGDLIDRGVMWVVRMEGGQVVGQPRAVFPSRRVSDNAYEGYETIWQWPMVMRDYFAGCAFDHETMRDCIDMARRRYRRWMYVGRWEVGA